MTDFFLLVGKISPAKSLEIITQFNQTKLSTQHQSCSHRRFSPRNKERIKVYQIVICRKLLKFNTVAFLYCYLGRARRVF